MDDDDAILNALVREPGAPAPGDLAWVATLGVAPDVQRVLEAAAAVVLVEKIGSQRSALDLLRSRTARLRGRALYG
jgi:hypothetical protein